MLAWLPSGQHGLLQDAALDVLEEGAELVHADLDPLTEVVGHDDPPFGGRVRCEEQLRTTAVAVAAELHHGNHTWIGSHVVPPDLVLRAFVSLSSIGRREFPTVHDFFRAAPSRNSERPPA